MADFLYTLIIYPLYQIIECIYVLFEKVVGNPGVCVIGVSIGITLLCLPLYAVAEHWQQVERDKEKSMEKQLERIKETFSGDERYMMTQTYYKECRYSPLMALRSSFGLLIQVPFFIAAYSFLSNSPALHGAQFLFIRDMGVQDALFHIGSFPVNVLPIAMTVINIIAGAIYTKGFKWKDKISIYGMALIFLVILYNSPSGLVLYWTMNNIFSLVKNIFYKLKKPLKVFWISSCAMMIPVVVYVFINSPTKPSNKMLLVVFTSIIYILPLIVKNVKSILNGPLAFLIKENKIRHSIFFISALILFVLTGLVIPSTLISSSPIEFAELGLHDNPVYFIINTSKQALGIFIFWALCIYFLFNKKIQTVFSVGLCITAFAAVLNTYAFMLSYGDISNTLKFLATNDFKTVSLISLVNLSAIAIIFAAVIFGIKFLKGKIIYYTSCIIALSLSVLSVLNISSISTQFSDYKKNFSENNATSIEPIFHLSKNHENVVLIMLDMAQGQFVTEQLKEDPELYEKFSGFTFYNNAVSFNGHTIMGSPGVYGGYEYTPLEMNRRKNIPLVEKHNQALLMLPRIFNEQKGYSVVLTDPSWPNYQQFCDLSFVEKYPEIKAYKTVGKYFTLWNHQQEPGTVPADTDKILERNMLYFSFFRSSPIVLRKLIYKGGTYWSSDSSAENGKAALDSYTALYFLNELTDISETEKGTYTCIVNQLTHENDGMIFEAPDYVPVKNVTNLGSSKFNGDNSYHTQMASFKLLSKWFDYLKANGIYDNTRIVITSDHGGTSIEDDFEQDFELDKSISGGQYTGRGHYHCLFMYKDFNENGPLKESRKFMTNADGASLLVKDLVQNPVNPFTGKLIPYSTDELKKNGVFISAADTHQPTNNGKYTFSIKDNQWWLVKDDIFKVSNWNQVTPRMDIEE